MEIWTEIEGFDNYSVSDHGNVRNDRFDRILTQTVNQRGICTVGLFDGVSQKRRSVTKLVADGFLTANNPRFDTPINKDGDRTNNHIDNLTLRPKWFAHKYHAQFKNPMPTTFHHRMYDMKDFFIYDDSYHAATANGLLEKAVVLAVHNQEVVYPTFQQFRLYTGDR